MLRNKQILIIGGAGFIGSNLAEHLIKNNNVVSIDNYSTGRQENHVKGVDYRVGNSKDIFKILKNDSFDIVFHFGEYARVEKSLFEIEKVLEYNLYSLYKVVKYVKSINAKLVYAGSSTKFGDEGENKHASPYAWTKSTNTEFIKNFAEWYELNHAIVYFYNAYGNNEISQGDYSTLIAKYIKMCMDGATTLPVVKPGTQIRNFTHVTDIVKALDLVAEKGAGDDYGIGSDESFSILDVVKMFGKDVEWLPERRGNRLSAILKTEKTKNLGWKPSFDLVKYIQDKGF
jgi:UDP-glucose 4-epimerase